MSDRNGADRGDAAPLKTVCYRRVLLKLSGEALMGEGSFGIDPRVVRYVAQQVAAVWSWDVEMAIVIGGGNIFRGIQGSASGMDRASADYVGMLATVMNALCLQDALEKEGVPTRVMTAIEMSALAEPYIRRRAIRHLEKGRVVVFAAGTGNPFFTTDTAAALRAMEIGADVLLKATKVDGVFTADPTQDPTARHLPTLTYDELILRGLKVMDATAAALCKDNGLPIIVYDLKDPTALRRAIAGENVGSTVRAGTS